jgi:hypothetical protein
MRRFVFLAAALLVVGCGGDGLRRVSVQGKLSVKGQPLEGAVIQFIPVGATKGEGGIGRSGKEGAFTLISSRAGAGGIAPGEYRVRLSRMVEANGTPLPDDARDADYPGSWESVPPQYTSPDGSPLKVTVPESGGAVVVDIPVPLLGRR